MVKKLLFFGIFTIALIFSAQAQVVDQVGYVERGKASYFADDRGGIFTASGERYNMNALIAAHPFIAFNSFVKVTNLDNGASVIVRINDRAVSKGHIIELSKAAADRIGSTGQLSIDTKIEIVPNPSQPGYTPLQQPANTAASPQKNDGGVTVGSYNNEANVEYKTPAQAAEAQREVTNKPQPNTTPTTATPAPKEDKIRKTLAEMMDDVGTYKLDGTPVKPLGYGVQVGWFSKAEEATALAQRFKNLQFGNIYVQSGWESGKKAYRVLIGSFTSKDATQGLVDFLNERHYNAFARKHYGID